MRLIPFHPNHVSFLQQPVSGVTEQMRNPIVNWEEWARDHVDEGSAYTGLDHNDNIVACGGIVKLWDQHGDAWFYGTHHLPKHIKSVVKVLRKSIEIIAEQKDYKRVSTHVLADWDEALRFIKFLGFKEEGFHPKYGPNETDYYSYARIF
tara:strand:+ start:280 stop:729 length:450 start_codon:yes stop_codon:yes gene_type:complete